MLKGKRVKSLAVLFLFLLSSVLMAGSNLLASEDLIQYTEADAREAYTLLHDTLVSPRLFYRDYRNQFEDNIDRNDSSSYEIIEVLPNTENSTDETITIGYEEIATYEVEVIESGYYDITILHEIASSSVNNLTLAMQINEETPFVEASTIDVPLIWRDESKEYALDSYGDEALPNQVRIEGVDVLELFDNTYNTTRPLEFYLEEGINSISFENISADLLTLGTMSVSIREETLTYDEYRDSVDNPKIINLDEVATINATNYIHKNSSFVRLGSLRSPDVSPYDPVDRKINIIDGEGWSKSGQTITYEFEVPEDGDYAISLHYNNGKDDYSVFRTIAIDGEVPFEEMYDYSFPNSRQRWANITLGENETDAPYLFNLSAGRHTISLTSTQGLLGESLNTLQVLIDHINQFALEIRKITGKDIDRDRTWVLTSYLPETAAFLEAYEVLITDLLNQLSVHAPNGTRSTTLSFLSKAIARIQMMRENPDELPLHFEYLYSGTGSVTQMLGDTIDRLNNAGMSLNAVYVGGAETELPDARASLLDRIGGGLANFVSTFTEDKYLVRPDEDAVNVWVSRPITYVDIMQKLVDSEFTPRTGVKVKISVMPDTNKLILSNAAGEVPDVALGLPSYMPFDIALRGAAYPLSDFEDFWEVAAQSTPGAYVPYVYNDNVYAFPETLDFQALIYRKDVFQSLGLEAPETWEEIIGILPVLQRYGMNFYHNIAGGTGTKWFYQTTPLIFQNGGMLYEEDGFFAAIDEPEAVLGLTQLSELFTMYSLPNQVPNFYNSFRYSQLPIGMVDFNTYLQIANAAPELKGQWELANFPGIRDENGEIQRWFVGNGTSAVIMEKTQKPDEAWDFLKWWTSTEIQTSYANLLTSTYGPEYVWLSSNLAAARNAPIPEQDKQVILDQIPWLRDVPRTPGQYMLERGMSDVWSQAVQDGLVPRVAIDEQIITINREIRRKMLEFGFIDQDGKQIRPYTVRDVDWIQEQIDMAKSSATESTD